MWRATSRSSPTKVADVIHEFFTSKGYKMSPRHLPQGARPRRRQSGLPADLNPYMQQQAEVLLREKRIAGIPDWKKVLRTDFMDEGARQRLRQHRELRQGRRRTPALHLGPPLASETR